MTGDTSQAAKILEVHPDDLKEAVVLWAWTGMDQDVGDVGPVDIEVGDVHYLRRLGHDLVVTASCPVCRWSREYLFCTVDWERPRKRVSDIHSDHRSQSDGCSAAVDLLTMTARKINIATLSSADVSMENKAFSDALQINTLKWPVDDADREEAVRRAAELGSVQAVKSAIHDGNQGNAFTSLWGIWSPRFDARSARALPRVGAVRLSGGECTCCSWEEYCWYMNDACLQTGQYIVCRASTGCYDRVLMQMNMTVLGTYNGVRMGAAKISCRR